MSPPGITYRVRAFLEYRISRKVSKYGEEEFLGKQWNSGTRFRELSLRFHGIPAVVPQIMPQS